ncbi:LysR family transcriptional regulator [Paraburkholderia sp. J12]|uniref:LysR family transcriptional regulator n=1 Tax=Paraburkholderia sp. J12 TaxID=2805432 RepID=UPI002ABE6F4D|nr:LysR family transcriptional regulator [Paraburkholderia sp. J12]
MPKPLPTFDLNLLRVLDALLEAGSVVGAAQRVHLSAPAVSRALGRLRDMVGDPLMVRAGRGLVPTPRAEALRPQVRALLEQAQHMLAPGALDPGGLKRTFVIRAMDSFATTAGPILAQRLRESAPNVTLRFVSQGTEAVEPLRSAEIDLDIGVIDDTGPEVKRQALYREHLVGVARRGHPLVGTGRKRVVNAAKFAACAQVAIARVSPRGPLDAALAARGLSRSISLVVQHENAALLAVAASDLVTVVGASLARHGANLGLPIAVFELPVSVPDVQISLAWHPRLDADRAHRWLRDLIRSAVAAR